MCSRPPDAWAELPARRGDPGIDRRAPGGAVEAPKLAPKPASERGRGLPFQCAWAPAVPVGSCASVPAVPVGAGPPVFRALAGGWCQ